jgi:hypothetical protein
MVAQIEPSIGLAQSRDNGAAGHRVLVIVAASPVAPHRDGDLHRRIFLLLSGVLAMRRFDSRFLPSQPPAQFERAG